jgi:hypothetical protein
MAVGTFDQRRALIAALLNPMFASWFERASGRKEMQRMHGPFNR